MSYSSAGTAQEFELDCSRFDGLSPAALCASSFDLLSSAGPTRRSNPPRRAASPACADRAAERGMGGGGLSRTRCARDLSSLCGACSASQTSSYESEPNASWGYFVGTPSR
eukprot:CAMPEP_0172579632 /NCGR_PEP_ID=MMETSP1067-20121228/139348_1 /TAXON_ID=265564 ORGANISM="Thalassiosira punctigera, Strain Tpunct2005C2" /NCGR_SAMPLE_ID=MMETSP1067 /ASSEMBLY_ACC=CAM_ASM_000444 /LENGTH=110 /DNA_ID=CAMNT_0013372357 /DNA_START=754 /DNA_END=1086 /DNA_ORIENTATION=+